MVDLYKEIDFSDVLKNNPQLQQYLQKAAQEIQSSMPADEIKKPFIDKEFNNYIIVCNLPKVDKEKFPTLQKVVIERILPKLNLSQYLKRDMWGFEPGNTITNGSLVLEFTNQEYAEQAQINLNTYLLDKQHTLLAYSANEFDKLFAIPNQFEQPKILAKSNLMKWLFDENRRDQYSFRLGDKFYIYWFFHLEKEPQNYLQLALQSENNEKIDNFIQLSSQSRVEWSKNGTYLVEYLEDGFQIYGGERMQLLNFYKHENVRNVEFSPDEKYILSFNGPVTEAPDSENYIVWNVIELDKIRSFKAEQQDTWGTCKWSYDSKYLAKIGYNHVSVYELPSMTLLKDSKQEKGTPIVVFNIQKFAWLQKSNILVCASYSGNLRTRDNSVTAITKITPIEIPSRKELKWKTNNFEITEMDLISSENGNWFAAVMKKKLKQKMTSTLVQIANFKKREVIEVSDLEFNDKVQSYNFETKVGRFGFVFKEEDQQKDVGGQKYKVQIYEIDQEQKSLTIKEVGKFQNKLTQEILWSRNGVFFALVNKDPQSAHQGVLEVGYLRKDKQQNNTSEITRSYSNLSYMTHTEWDPSGRYILTSSSTTKSFQVWNAFGEQLFKDTFNQDNLHFINWRPRPKYILEEKEELQITTDLKNYKKRYEDEDEKITNNLKYEKEMKRKQMKEEFEKYMQTKRQLWDSSREERIKLKGYDDDNLSDLITEELIENEIVIDITTSKA